MTLSFGVTVLYGQEEEMTKHQQDSLYIREVEESTSVRKVMHAEPLYIDLIRDLGARKGEREWNVGAGIIDNQSYDRYEALVEYEWAPANRLGLEVELPFSFYYPSVSTTERPGSKLNALKVAAQYTFLVSVPKSTSMAIGYIQELEMTEFRDYGKKTFFPGAVYNPFLIIAKRWGTNLHSLLYTGPVIGHHFETGHLAGHFQINSSFHYMISGTRNFVGVELNKEVHPSGDFDMVIRPQMRVGITDHLLVGIVTGVPISKENQRFSSFVRLIYEPRGRH